MAVVTGAASGLGAAVSKALAAEGCSLVLADRDLDRLQRVTQDCETIGSTSTSSSSSTSSCDRSSTTMGGGDMHSSRVTYVECDVSNESNVRALFEHVQQPQQTTLSHASILVNCAGITRDGWIGRMSVDQWQQVQDVNLMGTFLCCREFLAQRALLSHKKETPSSHHEEKDESQLDIGGSIINIASVVATQGNLGQVNYAASKGGVVSLTKALAREVAPRRIRVNCVLPGFIATEMTDAVPEAVKESISKKIVWQQQFGQPEDVANLVLFLASCRRSGYITGEAMECSGMISL